MRTIDIEREIRRFLKGRFLFGSDLDLPNDDSLLGNSIDSVGVLDLVIFLQDQFKITVEDEDVVPGNLDSVKNMVAYIAGKLGIQES